MSEMQNTSSPAGSYNMPPDDDERRRMQVDAVEQYYHSTIERLSDEQISQLGSDVQSIRETIFKASLIKGGVDLRALSTPAGMTGQEVQTLLVRDSYVAEGRWGVGTRREADTKTLLMAPYDERAQGYALQEAGITPERYAEMQGKRKFDEQRFRVNERTQDIVGGWMRDPAFTSQLEAKAQYVDTMRSRLVVTPNGAQSSAGWTPARRAAAQEALGLSEQEAAVVSSYKIVPTPGSSSGVRIYAYRNGQYTQSPTEAGTPFLADATDEQTVKRMKMNVEPVLHPENTALGIEDVRTRTYTEVGITHVPMPSDRHSILNQHALLSTIWAEALISTGRAELSAARPA